MIVSDIERLNFKRMIEKNLYFLTRIRNGKPASHLFKPARLKRFARTGILCFVVGDNKYRLTDKARDAVDAERLRLIRGDRK